MASFQMALPAKSLSYYTLFILLCQILRQKKEKAPPVPFQVLDAPLILKHFFGELEGSPIPLSILKTMYCNSLRN